MSGWLHRCWYRMLYYVVGTVSALAFSLRIKGKNNVPPTGPVLLLANHQSFLDPPMIAVAAERELKFLARKTLFRNPLFAALIRSCNAIPIDQEGVGKEGIRAIIDQLQLQHAVLVFPEGTRTEDGKMNLFKPGVHLLIKRCHATIVPVGVAGAYEAYPIHQKLPRLAPVFWPGAADGVAIVIGEPFDSRHYDAMQRDEVLADLHARIAECVARAESLRRR